MGGGWLGEWIIGWVSEWMSVWISEWRDVPAAQSLFGLQVREPRTQKQESYDWGLLALKPFHYLTFNKQILDTGSHLLIFKQEKALGVGNGQGSLVCCSPCDCKESESDTTERLN